MKANGPFLFHLRSLTRSRAREKQRISQLFKEIHWSTWQTPIRITWHQAPLKSSVDQALNKKRKSQIRFMRNFGAPRIEICATRRHLNLFFRSWVLLRAKRHHTSDVTLHCAQRIFKTSSVTLVQKKKLHQTLSLFPRTSLLVSTSRALTSGLKKKTELKHSQSLFQFQWCSITHLLSYIHMEQ